jgi:hypothetical protein
MTQLLEILLLVVVLGVPGTAAQENPPENQDTVLTFVRDFLQVFYPQLIVKGNRLNLCINHPADSSWREISGVYFTLIVESPTHGDDFESFLNEQFLSREKPGASNTILLDGSIWLPPSRRGSRIQQLTITSRSIVRKKYDDFVASIKLHPEWTNEHLVMNLNMTGARFGPDKREAMLHSVPWKDAERFLGNLSVTDAVFSLPDEERVGSFEAGKMRWTVSADTHFQDGTDGKYAFEFEPYEGKLIGMWRLHMQKTGD